MDTYKIVDYDSKLFIVISEGYDEIWDSQYYELVLLKRNIFSSLMSPTSINVPIDECKEVISRQELEFLVMLFE